ncbi:hypothetical protein N431DRAFT_443133 [Stipitochalara longipes BDJ]|nr:hypothetical protein N431DRAFT_443133 [Stipitochalara longipes BDJ]
MAEMHLEGRHVWFIWYERVDDEFEQVWIKVDTDIQHEMHARRGLRRYLSDSAFRFTSSHGPRGIKEEVKLIKMFASEILKLRRAAFWRPDLLLVKPRRHPLLRDSTETGKYHGHYQILQSGALASLSTAGPFFVPPRHCSQSGLAAGGAHRAANNLASHLL